MATLSIPIASGEDDGYYATALSSYIPSGISVSMGSSNGNEFDAWLRFQVPDILRNAEIHSCYIEFTAASSFSTVFTLLIEGISQINPTAPTSRIDIRDRPRTTENITWSPPTTTSNTKYQTPDITPIMQELTNLSGRQAGHYMMFHFAYTYRNVFNEWRNFRSYEGNPEQVAVLHVDYTNPDNADPEIIVNPTVDYQGFSRLGPQNSPVEISFVIEDIHQTGEDEILWEIVANYPPPPEQNYISLAAGTCTSGIEKIVPLSFDTTGLTGNGVQSLYLFVFDTVDGYAGSFFDLLQDNVPATITNITLSVEEE